MNTVTCTTCAHASSLTKHGFVRCKVSRRPGWTPSPTWPRTCEQHRLAAPAVIAKREGALNAR